MSKIFIEQGGSHEQRHADVPSDGRDRTDPSDVNLFLSQFDFGSLLASADTFDLSGFDGSDEVGLVPDEGLDEVPCSGDQESAVAALRDLPNAGAPSKRAKDKGLNTFTEEDFEEGSERLAFRILKANVDCLFDNRRKPDDCFTALHWIFAAIRSEFSFHNCCISLGTRPDVLRLRINFEMWSKWMTFPMPLPFEMDPIPDTIEGGIYYYAGDKGYQLARAAWQQPGISNADLLATVTEAMAPRGPKETFEADLRKALEVLSERHIMSIRTGHWYLTGRNPSLEIEEKKRAVPRSGRNQVSWSSLF